MTKSNLDELADRVGKILEECDPFGKPANTPGAKLDSGKASIVRGFMAYFPRAIKAVAEVSKFGAKKYTWNGWQSVPDGVIRYTDALGRHIIEEIIDGAITPDSNLLHASHAAWNAMARLELMLREQENAKKS
jgi:hypothetical protein